MKLCLSGISGSGKSTAAEYLRGRHGFTVCEPGKICRKVSQLVYGVEDKTTLNKVNDLFRQLDPNIWVLASMRGATGDRILIDGVRFLSNYELLRPQGFKFWKISTVRSEARTRLVGRGQDFEPAADEVHSAETELEGLPYDAVIENNGCLDMLRSKLDELIANEERVA